jgi:hypothetical protein
MKSPYTAIAIEIGLWNAGSSWPQFKLDPPFNQSISPPSATLAMISTPYFKSGQLAVSYRCESMKAIPIDRRHGGQNETMKTM